MPPVLLKPLVTLRVWPEATWTTPSVVPVAPKVTTGTLSEAVAPAPLPFTSKAPVVSVSVVGVRPDRPPTAGALPTNGPVEIVSALSVWLPVSELAVAEVARKVCVGAALRMLVTDA